MFGTSGSTENKGGLFNSTTPASKPSGGFSFGGSNDNKDSGSTTPAFGSSTPSFTGFGNNAATTTSSTESKPATTTASSGFGGFGNTATSGSGGMFGQKTEEKSNQPASGGLFGANAGSGGGLFAKQEDKKENTPTFGAGSGGGMFGQKPEEKKDQQGASGGLFGGGAGATTGGAGGLFGQKTEDKPSGGLFGQKPTEEKKDQPTSGGLFNFGSKSEEKKENQPASTGGLFGQKSEEKKDQSTGGLFGQKTEDKKDQSTGGLFGQPKTEDKKDQPAGSLFGQQKTEDKKDQPAGGLFGQQKAEEKKDQPTGGLFGQKPEEKKDETKDTSKPLFGGGTTEKNDENKPTDSKTAAANIQDIAPSAYLKNKSFEDIIAKWTSALAKNTSEFQAQATNIASWDRVLVENGEKISDLYNQVVQAEQNQGKIDQLLQYVGKQQDDLEGLLEGYEKQASEFLTNLTGPEGLQPVDQDREKAYRLAEDLNEKLENMGGNLSSVIEEINKVSNDLNHAKEDDALTQIVKILNSHLSSLQWIDSNTTYLQEKLDQIQTLEAQTRSHVMDSSSEFLRSHNAR